MRAEALRRLDKTLIHVGLAKTGTTLIQQALFQRHPQVGFLGKPFCSVDMRRATMSLNRDDSLTYDADEISATFHREIERNFKEDQALVISEEDLSNVTGIDRYLKAIRLKAIFDGGRVLVVLRRPEELFVSTYYQWVRSVPNRRARFLEIDQWAQLTWKKLDNDNLSKLKYAKLIKLYENVFGRENVHVMLFEKLRTDVQSFAHEICEITGVDGDVGYELLNGERRHDRVTDRQVEFSRTLKPRLFADMSDFESCLETYVDTLPDEVVDKMASARAAFCINKAKRIDIDGQIEAMYKSIAGWMSEGSKPPSKLSAEWQKTVEDFTRAGNQHLAQEYGLPLADNGYPV
ncbi:MAG: hypothetical protein ACI835_002083 [Planctomycetota bacterium]